MQAYVHRVGRTGRAGQAGTAITLFADKDEPLRQDLAQELGHKSASASEGADQCPNHPRYICVHPTDADRPE